MNVYNIIEIEYTVRTLFPPYPFNCFKIEPADKTLTRTARGTAPKSHKFTESEYTELLKSFDKLQIENWKPDYHNRNVIDGYAWGMTIIHANNQEFKVSGSNDEPETLRQWTDFLSEFEPPDKPEIVNFALEVKTDWLSFKYVDSVSADYNAKILSYKQKQAIIDDGKFDAGVKIPKEGLAWHDIDHKHTLSDSTLNDLFFTVADTIKHEPWIESDYPKEEISIKRVGHPCSLFVLSAVCYDGTKYEQEGWYDRRSIDGDGITWRTFIGKIKSIINEGYPRFLLEKNKFFDTPRQGEQRYLHVMRENDSPHIGGSGIFVKSNNYDISFRTTVKITEQSGESYEAEVFEVAFLEKGKEPEKLIKNAKIEALQYDHSKELFADVPSRHGHW
jgi:hypothetical protein